MRIGASILLVSGLLSSCATLESGPSLPPGLTVSSHVVVSVPRTGRTTSFLGTFRVDYGQSAPVLDPFKSRPIKASTESLAVEFDKRDAARVSLLGQTDNYRASWKGTVNGAPFAIDLVFRSPDFSKKSDTGDGTITKLLELAVSSDTVTGCELVAAETVGLPSVLWKYLPSGDKVTMNDPPSMLSLGGNAARFNVVGAVEWPTQVFVLDLADGGQAYLKGGLIHSARPLSEAEEDEVALIEVLRGILRTLG